MTIAALAVLVLALPGASLGADKDSPPKNKEGKIIYVKKEEKEAEVRGVQVKGRLSFEDYISNDSSDVYSRHFFTTTLRLNVSNFNKGNTLKFNFDGRSKSTFSDYGYNDSIKGERIDYLNLEYRGIRRFGNFTSNYMAFGRLSPKELYIERVDGVNILFRKSDAKSDKIGYGLYGGTKPNPYSGALSTDFSALGLYTYYKDKYANGAIAVVHNGYKGKADRQYLLGRLSYYPEGKFRLYGSLTADRNIADGGVNLSNLSTSLSYRVTSRASATVGYNHYRTIRLYESMEFVPNTTTQSSYYLRGNANITDRISVYGKYESQSYAYEIIPMAGSPSKTKVYQLGVVDSDLFKKDIRLSINTTFADRYNGEYTSYTLDISKYLKDKLNLSARLSYMDSKYDITNVTDTVLSTSVSAHLTITPKLSIMANYDSSSGDTYSTNSFTSRLSYRF